MSKNVKYKSKKKRINLLRLLLLAVVGIVVAYFVVSAVKIVNLSNEKAEIEKKNQELKETVEDLNQQLEIINTDKYMEGLARKRLKLVHSNEILFILPDLRMNENDETVGPTDMAMEEAQRLVDAKEAEEKEKAEKEAEKSGSEENSEGEKDKEGDSNG